MPDRQWLNAMSRMARAPLGDETMVGVRSTMVGARATMVGVRATMVERKEESYGTGVTGG